MKGRRWSALGMGLLVWLAGPPAGPLSDGFYPQALAAEKKTSVDAEKSVPVAEKGPGEAATGEAKVLRLSLNQARLLALEHNRAWVVERINPAVDQTFVEEERASFDAAVEAELSAQRSDVKRQVRTGNGTENATTDTYEATLALKDFFPSGTTLEVGAATSITDSSLYQDPFTSTRLGLTVTQALLRGFGSAVNTAKLRQSQLAVDISAYELRGFCETLISQVENAYWDYALAQREIEILEESLRLARQQLAETQDMIQVGSMAETELVAVQAQVALQQQGLINARSQLAHARLQLLRLLNPRQPLWDLKVELIHPPSVPQVQLEAVSAHEEVARRMRPELKQAELEVEQQTIELVRTRNGLLPQMDFFVTLGKSGYAESFGQSVQDLDGDSYDLAAGIEFQFPLANHAAKAQHKRARLRQDQKAKALENLTQLVELDVRRAYIEVSRTEAQIKASTATRKFEAEKLRVETERFRVGRATSLTVAQAQQDLLVARIGEVRAVVDYLKALTEFYRLEGSLLRRRGIQAPGAEPLPEKGPPPS